MNLDPQLLIVLPTLLMLLGAASAMLAYGSLRAQGVIGLVATGGLVAVAILLLRTVLAEGAVAVQVGSWPAPFGLTLIHI